MTDYDDDYTGASREPDFAGAGFSRPFIAVESFDAIQTFDDDADPAVRVVGIRDDGHDGFEFIVMKVDGNMILVDTAPELYLPDDPETEAT